MYNQSFKNSTFLLTIAVLLSFVFTGCRGVGDVITQNPREYVYKTKEEIRFYDNVKTGDLLSSLTFVSMFTLSDSTFMVTEQQGKDENGNIIYEDVVYEQIIQINYCFNSYDDSVRDISRSLVVVDENGTHGTIDPPVKYSEIPVDGTETLVVALKNKSNKINIQIFYSGIIMPNAVVEMSEIDDEGILPNEVIGDNSVEQKLKNMENQIKEKESVIKQYEEMAERHNKTESNLYLIILVFGFCSITELSIILVLLFKRKKFEEKKKL